MSTEKRSLRPRRRSTLIRVVAVVALAPAGARAAEWRFLPSVDLAFYRDGNVAVTGSNGGSDEVARVGVNFDFEWDKPVTSTRLSYSPYREFYNELTDLDYTAHQLTFNVSHEPSRRSSFHMDLGGLLTDRQPVQTLRPDSTVTLVPRSEQINAYLALSGRVGVGRRSFFDWAATGALTEFPEDTAGTLTDTDTYGVAAGWGVEINEKCDIGARARGERLGFEAQVSTDLATLEVFFDYEFSRSLSLALVAGATDTKTGPASSTDPKFDARLTQTFRDGSELEGGLIQHVSNAAGASGATLDRGAFLSLRPKSRTERFSAQLTTYYWDRAPVGSASSTPTIETFEALAAVAWTPKGGHFALGGFYSYHDQNDATGQNPSVGTSYSSGGVFFRWNFQGVRGVGS